MTAQPRVTIVLCLWKGWRPVYGFRDVRATVRLLRAAGFNQPTDRIICATNMTPSVWLDPECELVPLWPEPTGFEHTGRPTCYRRLRLFDPGLQKALGIAAGEIVMSVDLDTLPCGDMRPLLRALGHATYAAMGGLAARLHGALWAFKAGSHGYIWQDFNPQRSPLTMHVEGYMAGMRRQIGSDQAWMSYKLPKDVPTWETMHGVYSWNRHGQMSPGWTVNNCFWSFAGSTKPRDELVKQVRPDLHSMYMKAYGED